jgi:hypothetical protein
MNHQLSVVFGDGIQTRPWSIPKKADLSGEAEELFGSAAEELHK